ncbi:unnamed protein product, partial [Ostreobium quekettii]
NGMGSLRSRSLDSLQSKAQQFAALERALSASEAQGARSARDSTEDCFPHLCQAPERHPQLDMAGGGSAIGLGDRPTDFDFAANRAVQGLGTPFLAMNRDIEVPPGLLLGGWSSGGSGQLDDPCQGCELFPRSSRVSL